MVVPPRLIVFDRDGVLNNLVTYDNAIGIAPRRLADLVTSSEAGRHITSYRALGIKTAIATNQPDVARGKIASQEAKAINEAVRLEFEIDAAYMCPHDDSNNCVCRKPKPGMLRAAMSNFKCDVDETIFVGDSTKDLQAGRSAGVRTFLFAPAASKEHKFKSVPFGDFFALDALILGGKR
jgi:D-glycero-D-manno-heptose 1,7-bisphosphate phosphatase